MTNQQDPQHFDVYSGSFLERLIFNHRVWFILLCAVVTGFLGYQAVHLRLSSSYRDTLPRSSPYIQNYLKYKHEVPQLGNLVRIVVQTKHGTIYNAHYQHVLHHVYNTLYSIPGIYEVGLKALWSPNVRYTEVTPQGFKGGPVMPNNYNGSKKSLEKLRHRVDVAGLVGRLVGGDLKSSMLVAPLLEKNPKTGKPLNYQRLSHELDSKIRSKAPDDIKIHTIGFAKIQGSHGWCDGGDGLFCHFISHHRVHQFFV
jgi:predicted RND superfamily exporter protein